MKGIQMLAWFFVLLILVVDNDIRSKGFIGITET